MTQNIQYDEHKSCVLDVAQPLSKSNGLGACRELKIAGPKGKTIYGVISEPTAVMNNATKQANNKHGVAIISHGFNGTHHFGKDYFQTLNNLGYAVYSFDFPCGSVNSQSDNNTKEMSILDEKEALKAIVKYFKGQKNIDKDKIVLIGESQGGLVSALTAAELKKQISKLVLIYPALCIPDNWNERYPADSDIPETTMMWNVPLGKRFFMECRKIDVYKTIGRYTGPVLIVHGTDDKVVPLSYSERAQSTYTDCQLKPIQKAGHGFNPQERGLSNQFVRDFLK